MTSELVQNAYFEASASARISSFEVGDPEGGGAIEVSPAAMWQRGLLPLPAGSEIAHMDIPDLPTDFLGYYKLELANVCTQFGVPAEYAIGGLGGAKIANASLTQEQIRATVLSARRDLESDARFVFFVDKKTNQP
jgi:hypothetical protein